MIKAVIFDMDGVLFDTERVGMRMQAQAGKELGFPVAEELVMKTLGTTIGHGRQVFLDELGADFPYDRMVARWAELMLEENDSNGMPLKPGLLPLIKELKKQGIRTGVATSNNQSIVHKYLIKAGLLETFDAIICGDRVKRSKPEPDIYLAAAQALSVAPEDCMGIEDSINGVRSVRAAGMTCVMVPDLIPYTDDLAPYVDHCFPTLDHIISLLFA